MTTPNSSVPFCTQLCIDHAGHVYTPGINYELGGKTLDIVARNTHTQTIVIRVPGHSYWDGNYSPRGYAPVEYEVYRIKKSEKPKAKS